MAVGFFGPADPTNPNATMDELARRQAFAELLTKGAAASKPKNWHEGAVSGLGYLLGGIERKSLDKQQSALQKEANANLAKVLLTGQGSPLTPSSTGFDVTPGPAAGPSPSSPAGGSRAAAEIQTAADLDPQGRDLAIRTILAEAGGQGPEGLAAVANVIRNRVKSGRYGGNTIAGVVRAPSQFEPWNTPEGRAKIYGFDPESTAYKSVGGIVDRIFSGDESDPTGGATHFYAPVLQGQLGRNAPKWAAGTPLATIGGHSFYAPEGTVQGGSKRTAPIVWPAAGGTPEAVTNLLAGKGSEAAPAAGAGAAPTAAAAVPTASAAPSGGISPQLQQAVVQMLQSGNPYEAQAAQPLLAAILKQQMTPAELTITAQGPDLVAIDQRTGREVNRIKGAAGTQKLLQVPAGGAVLDPTTGKVVYTNQPEAKPGNIEYRPHGVDIVALQDGKEVGRIKGNPETKKLPDGWRTLEDGRMEPIPGGPADPAYIASTKNQGSPPLSVTDRKAIFAAEDENVNLEGTVSSLNRAKELNPKTFTGAGAGLLGVFGSKVPVGVVEEEAAKATQEWEQIMSLEAIQAMAKALAGATTNMELEKFVKIMADPSTPADTRARTIDRMLSIANSKLRVNNARIEELRSGTYWNTNRGEAGKEGAKAEAGVPGNTRPINPGVPAQPKNQEEYDALPSGTPYVTPDGSQKVKK